MFKKILIANRGEIAVRILRACREMDIPAAVVFSSADRAALHVRLADESHFIGSGRARENYLSIEKMLDVARRADCDAVHPGCGLLAENLAFARACAQAGITFIGPPPDAMESFGSKTNARQIAGRAGVPMVPGAMEPIEKPEEAESLAQQLGYPVLLKAVTGRGAKSMRIVNSSADLAGAWRDAGSEAQATFGDARLYLEKYLLNPRHIEFQILADAHGRVVSLGERECSIQLLGQRALDEAPSPAVTAELRKKMGDVAVRLARSGGYSNVGAVEFLVDDKLNFYFLKMNTALQAGHPVTELVTGLDLVKLQIAIAAGHRLPFAWETITPRGHAIQCRLRAEDAEHNFAPSSGKIVSCRAPSGPGIRLDEGMYVGWAVPPNYESILSKLAAWGNSREEAIARLRRALFEFSIRGVKTNAVLFKRIFSEPQFVSGEVHTRWLDELLLRAPKRA